MRDHSMFLHLTALHSHVSVEDVLGAVAPLLKFRALGPSNVSVQKTPIPGGPVGLNELFILLNDDETIKEVYICTYGYVPDTYYEVIEQVAKNLSPLSSPDAIELFNHESTDPETTLTRFWVGAGHPLLVAKRTRALKISLELLGEAGLTESQLGAVAFLVNNAPYENQVVKSAEHAAAS